jgi:hypothetical protein
VEIGRSQVQPVYYNYCGGGSSSDRIQVDTTTAKKPSGNLFRAWFSSFNIRPA